MTRCPTQLSRRSVFRAVLCSALCFTAPACDRYYFDSRPVSLRVTVVDANGAPRSGITVRIVEAWNEWSDDIRAGQEPWSKLSTDDRGRAFFDSEALALADLGFRESPRDRAVLGFSYRRNQAEFTIEVGTAALGFVEHVIPVRYRDSHLDVEIEYTN